MLKITINLAIMYFCYMETAIKKAPIDKRIEAFAVGVIEYPKKIISFL